MLTSTNDLKDAGKADVKGERVREAWFEGLLAHASDSGEMQQYADVC